MILSTLAKISKKSNHPLLKFSVVTSIFTISNIFITSVQAATVSFFDGTFNDSDWTLSSELRNGPDNFVITEEQVLSGGDPGSYRKLNFTWGNGTALFVYNLSDFIYDPSTQGAIETIDYSYSTIGFGSGGSYGDALLIEQDGKLFSGAFTGEPYANTWRVKSAFDLTSFDFASFDFDGSKPDFSELGTPIRFGYIRSSTQNGPVGTTMNGIDNWSVEIQVVPEPLTILGAGTAVAFGTSFKRKLAKAKKK